MKWQYLLRYHNKLLDKRLTQVKVPVHVRVGECGHEFAAVLDLEVELLVSLRGFCLSLLSAELHLLYLFLDHAKVIVSLSALFLFLFWLTSCDSLLLHWLLFLLRLSGFHINC